MSSVSPEATRTPRAQETMPPPPLSVRVPEADAETDFPDAVILDHYLNPETYRVTFDWKRVGVREQLVIPEVHAQLIDQNKVLDYWHQVYLTTRQVREQALRCEFYHVFQILDHRRLGRGTRSGFLLVQWVGYSDDPEEATWEPITKIDRVAPLDVRDYLTKKRLWKNLRPWPAWRRKTQDHEDARQRLIAAPSLLDEANQRLRSESTTRLSADLGLDR
ncbi:hypothetical protein COL154_012509 [Colletotrichum chrysophilum]|uniref:uncharacterized protein n=1 Tax=Colletotrichum chrysophilum TaxID=1836956 RepID=UPI002300D71C|nr:uncharacterized protein COL26b_014270 [Colletotrichum chrysophilum]KAJ0338232.1 hypothetical protein KNSL1_012521 [Colletotrichum chrysophilum]KAJ0352533.1 hypothetical protein COL154_012509 [Colletotrichum chrysophilum]KAJ0359764.1 hypothetical protein COL26b_014270 [Colletotrichum chrysophilum]